MVGSQGQTTQGSSSTATEHHVEVPLSEGHRFALGLKTRVVVAFNASKLGTDPSEALLASVSVETATIGLISIGLGESHILTANSNRLAVLDPFDKVGVALSGGDADLGQVSTGFFPRESHKCRWNGCPRI